MSALNREELWQRLCDAGLAQGEVPAMPEQHAAWYVRAMLGVAGWIGALFLLAFVGFGFAFVFDSGIVTLAVGAIWCAVAYAIFRGAPANDFAAQFAFAVSLAGQVMVAFGLYQALGKETGAPLFFAFACFEAVLAVLIANFLHRVWSSLAGAAALGYALAELGIYGAAVGVAAAGFALIWLNEHAWGRHAGLWRPAGYGLALALLKFEGLMLFGPEAWRWMGLQDAPDSLVILWMGPVLAGGVLVYAVYRLLTRHGVAPASRTGMAALTAAGAVALATLHAPGVASALLVLLLGFAAGNRVLWGIGVFALLGYLSHFYYSLHATLLAKSAVLMGTGIVLIALWAGMRMMFGGASGKERTHA